MSNFYSKLWLLAALLGVSTSAFSQAKYQIQLAAFTTPVAPSFWEYAGFADVKTQIDEHQIYRYVWGDFESFATGKSTLEELPEQLTCKQLVINNTASSLTTSTSSVRLLQPDLTKLSNEYLLFNRQISLSADQLRLSKLSVAQLDEVVKILTENPTLKLRLLPTTRHQNATKKAVNTPTRVIRNYLLAQNIPAYRIKTLSNPTATTVPHSGQEVRLLLVDLKEELVLDRFGPDGNFVEEKSATSTKNYME